MVSKVRGSFLRSGEVCWGFAMRVISLDARMFVGCGVGASVGSEVDGALSSGVEAFFAELVRVK